MRGPARIYYGWYVVAAAFAVMTLAFSCAYSFGTFFPELQREFGASRASISLIFSIAGALYFGLGAISGPLSDRYGPRWICVFGFIVLGVGLTVAASAERLITVYLGFGLGVGIGVGFSYVPSVGAVQPWFTTKRGFASGLAISGVGVGTLLGPVAASALIASYGWRTGFLVLGVTALVAGSAAALVLDNDPSKHGLTGAGAPDANPVQDRSLTVSRALRTRPFWLLYFASMGLSFALFVPFVHLVPYALGHGMPVATGALLLGLVGVGSTAGRFLIGAIADRWGRTTVFSACFFGVAITFFFWLFAREVWSLGAFALVFGSCYGGFVALAPAIVVDYYGSRAAGAIIGVLYSSVGIGTLFGPTLAGLIFDRSGTYQGAILAGELAACAGTALTMLLPDPGRWRRSYDRLAGPVPESQPA